MAHKHLRPYKCKPKKTQKYFVRLAQDMSCNIWYIQLILLIKILNNLKNIWKIILNVERASNYLTFSFSFQYFIY